MKNTQLRNGLKILLNTTENKTAVCIFNGDMSRGGGTEHITQILANLLAEDGKYIVWVLNCSNRSGKSYYPLDSRVNFAVLADGGVLKKAVSLLRFVKKNGIKVLINVDVMLGIFSLPAAFFHPSLKVIAWEMFNLRNDIGSRRTKSVRRLSLRKCAYYITQTKGDMEAFLSEMPVKCPITYIYNPCDEPADSGKYDADSKTIITAGHFFFTKGYDLAVDTARYVFSLHPDWRWEFYGDGDRFEETQKTVAEAGLCDNVVFCGRTVCMDQVYEKAAMYVMTSRTEGFGLVLTEAKSHRLPTLSFDIDFGPREIIEDGVSGYLVPCFDTEKMAERICTLIEDRDMRIRFSERAGDNLWKFSRREFLQSWEKVLSDITQHKPTCRRKKS